MEHVPPLAHGSSPCIEDTGRASKALEVNNLGHPEMREALIDDVSYIIISYDVISYIIL